MKNKLNKLSKKEKIIIWIISQTIIIIMYAIYYAHAAHALEDPTLEDMIIFQKKVNTFKNKTEYDALKSQYLDAIEKAEILYIKQQKIESQIRLNKIRKFKSINKILSLGLSKSNENKRLDAIIYQYDIKNKRLLKKRDALNKPIASIILRSHYLDNLLYSFENKNSNRKTPHLLNVFGKKNSKNSNVKRSPQSWFQELKDSKASCARTRAVKRLKEANLLPKDCCARTQAVESDEM